MSKSPLKFKASSYYASSSFFAQKNDIEYNINCSDWIDGMPTDLSCYVVIYDKPNEAYISTEHVKRFATAEEAQQYCQSIHSGELSLSSLREMISSDEKIREKNLMENAEGEAKGFTSFLLKKGIPLSEFFEVKNTWEEMSQKGRDVVKASV
jgi:hypothetical protein